MNYYAQITNPDATQSDLKLIAWIALTDRTMTYDQLHTVSTLLKSRMQSIKS